MQRAALNETSLLVMVSIQSWAVCMGSVSLCKTKAFVQFGTVYTWLNPNWLFIRPMMRCRLQEPLRELCREQGDLLRTRTRSVLL